MKEKGTINANPIFKISDHFSSQSKVYAKPFASDFNRTTVHRPQNPLDEIVCFRRRI